MSSDIQELIGVLDGINQRLDSVDGEIKRSRIEADQVRSAARDGASSGSDGLAAQIQAIRKVSTSMIDSSSNLRDMIADELSPVMASKKRRVLKFFGLLLLCGVVFLAGITTAQFMKLPAFGYFLNESPVVCEAANGHYAWTEDGRGYCIFWEPRES